MTEPTIPDTTDAPLVELPSMLEDHPHLIERSEGQLRVCPIDLGGRSLSVPEFAIYLAELTKLLELASAQDVTQ